MSLPQGTIKNTCNINKTPFVIFQAHPDDYYKFSYLSSNARNQDFLLRKLFFNPKNINLIQREIIAEVFRRTNGEFIIEKQNENDIIKIMKYVISQCILQNDCSIHKQIQKLDKLVINEAVSEIIPKIKDYEGYLERVYGPMQIMDHPLNTSIKGQKTLPSVTTIFHDNFGK
jgi:hypothetical protein